MEASTSAPTISTRTHHTSYTTTPGPGSSACSPHLLISIPWCSRILKWQAIVASLPHQSPSQAIDFIFDDDTFQPLLPISTSSGSQAAALRARLLSALLQTQTSVASPFTAPEQALHTLLDILLSVYLEHQRSALSAASARSTRLQFELSTLPHSEGLQLLHVPAREGEVSKACISIPLDSLDLRGLTALQEGSATAAQAWAQDPYRLHATFRLIDSNPDPELQLHTPSHAGPWLSGLALPPWSTHMCLMEYVPLLVDKMQAAINAAAGAVTAKRAFFDALSQALGVPLEYNRAASVAMYHIQYEQVPLLLHVDASSPRFPEDKPQLTVSNVRLLGRGPDGSRVYRDYPWSPRWGHSEMAARVHNFLKTELQVFVRIKNPIAVNAAAGSAVPLG